MTTQPSDAPPGLTPELEEAVRRGYAQRDRDNMAPTIAYFESLLAEHPGHPVLVYEVAGAYDTAGQEDKARGLYEQAMDLGLAGDPLRRCLCQYGSTLRWLGQYDKSLAALDRAKEEWPESDAVRVFRALTLNDANRSDEAVGELMTVITAHADVTDLGRWADGLRGLAQWLADGRPDDLRGGRQYRGHAWRACRSFSSPDLISMLKSRPRTDDNRVRVVSDGSCSPDSSRAMFGCRMPSFRASWT
jgi:tetratricopeptide (TPR) repeat protein